jgi:hypothetical protein
MEFPNSESDLSDISDKHTPTSNQILKVPTQDYSAALKETIIEVEKLHIDKNTDYLAPSDYTLQPDIKSGWLPKLNCPGAPIPLSFDLSDQDFEEAIDSNNIIYYGYRPKTTFELHKAFANRSSYPFALSDKLISLINEVNMCNKDLFNNTKRKCGMVIEDDLTFDSYFESGNLDMVVKVQYGEYDLYMRSDSNTYGHNQWFNFIVKNTRKMSVKFNVINFTKRNSLYESVITVTRE